MKIAVCGVDVSKLRNKVETHYGVESVNVKSVDELIKLVKKDIVNKFNEERSQRRIKDVNRMNLSDYGDCIVATVHRNRLLMGKSMAKVGHQRPRREDCIQQ